VTDGQKRQFVSDLYSGHKWKKRVEKMSDDQVVAIYLKSQQNEPIPEDTHSELDGFPEVEKTEDDFKVVDIPVVAHHPHWNEDDFPIY
jgi:hypothetical protein